MDKETKKEFGELGRMIKGGFDEAQEDRVKLRREMQNGFLNVNARLDIIEKDIKGFVPREEFEDLMGRVGYLEQKLGIVSGK